VWKEEGGYMGEDGGDEGGGGSYRDEGDACGVLGEDKVGAHCRHTRKDAYPCARRRLGCRPTAGRGESKDSRTCARVEQPRATLLHRWPLTAILSES
jgi:hypothetical protein